MKKIYLLGLIMASSIFTACGNSNTSPANPSSKPSISANTGKPVTFNIKIDKTVLSDKRDIEVDLYNDSQLKISENNSGCTVSYDTVTKTETTSCPNGVVYQKPSPEVYKFKYSDIKDSITINSTSVKSGERFLLTLSGMSSDNCNTAGARVEKNSASEQENIDNLQWASTMMACLNN